MTAEFRHGAGKALAPPALAAVFDEVTAAPAPQAVILIGGPGATPARAIGQVLEESPETMAVLRILDLAALLGGDKLVEAEAALHEALHHAQRSKLPAIVDDPKIAESPNETLGRFKAAGFSTRVVLAVERDSASALASSAKRLRTRALGAPHAHAPSVASEWEPTLETLRSIPVESLDRITVLDGDGIAVHDGPPSSTVWTALQTARRAPLSGIQGIAWLSELRRISEYVASARESLTRDDVVAVEQLYAVAQKRVLPELPVRPDSTAAAVQRERLRSERAQLKRLIAEMDRDIGARRTATQAGPNVSR